MSGQFIPRKADGTPDDAQFIRSPQLWPAFPILPMKRYEMKSGALESMECGVIHANRLENPLMIFVGTMFELSGTNLMDAKRYEYEDAAAAIDDGWIVD